MKNDSLEKKLFRIKIKQYQVFQFYAFIDREFSSTRMTSLKEAFNK